MALSVLTACAGRSETSFEPIPPQESLIRVDHPDFDRARALHSIHRDPATCNFWYVTEVNGPQALGVVVASRMQPGHEVIAQPTQAWIRGIISHDYRLAWGAEGETKAPSGPVRYRLFRMGDVRGPAFACVGFSRRRGAATDEGRPRDIAYGYFCRHGDRPLESATAERMLASVALGR